MSCFVNDHRSTGALGDDSLVVSSRRVQSAVIVSLTGDVDMLTAPQLLPAVEGCLHSSGCELLVVDLRAVVFLASAGLGALLDVRAFADARGLPMRVVVGDNRRVLRPFEITGMARVVSVHHSVDEALSVAGGDAR